MSDIPRTYILLATCNRARLLEETLESIRKQTYTGWECKVIDDHSEDNTREVVDKFAAKDSRFSYHLKSNEYKKGLSGSRNFGLDLVRRKKADFIQFFDDDDIMHPEKLELQANKLQEDPELAFCLCGVRSFNKREDVLWDLRSTFNYPAKLDLGEAFLLGEVQFVAQNPLFRFNYASAFKFDEDLDYAEEWALFVCMFMQKTPKYDSLNRVLFYRRKHSGAVTESDSAETVRKADLLAAKLKIFSFLNQHHLHTSISLVYFFRLFLLYQYDSKNLRLVGQKLKKLDRKAYLKFKTGIYLHKIFRKLILGLFRY
ncbi:glycosyltransferase family 2 protein [Salegentibacter chungangensis]|uniref:Glycosyltransferase family 2 protein n=1 Tax=Salegentibacter chungangensis TaxID=1335724 RepID=A0ABW3NQW6_9FLAO